LVAVIAGASSDLQDRALAAKGVAVIAKEANPAAKNFGPHELFGLRRKLESAERALIDGGPSRYRSEIAELDAAVGYLNQRIGSFPGTHDHLACKGRGVRRH